MTIATSGLSFASHSRTGTYASNSGFHAGSSSLRRSTTGPTDGTWDKPRPATILDGILEIARREELLEGLAAHLRAHAVQAVAGGRADLEQRVDVGARLDQPLEVAGPHQLPFTFREGVFLHVPLFVGLEGVAV